MDAKTRHNRFVGKSVEEKARLLEQLADDAQAHKISTEQLKQELQDFYRSIDDPYLRALLV